TCINPEKFRDNDILLEIKLKHDTRLLDVDSVGELKQVKWGKMLSYARQRSYDGILFRDTVLLFSNKKIERMERTTDRELQNIFSAQNELRTTIAEKI
ncbi:MAG TPA: hypothetical protein VFG24_02135, partial [Nitrosopumilaceae archaeon]|nr:hypothetical protein [Nitrosopumilaceae archaeon]